MGVEGFNNLDFLKGARPWIKIGPWIAAGGASTQKSLGHLQIDSVEDTKSVKKIEPPTILYPADVMYIGRTFKLVGGLWQADLDQQRLVAGDDASAIALDDVATPPTRVYRIGTDTDSDVPKYQVDLIIDKLKMQPLGTSGPTYIRRTVKIWMAFFEPQIKLSYKKDGNTIVPFTLEGLWDDSMPDDTKGYVGNWKDEAAA